MKQTPLQTQRDDLLREVAELQQAINQKDSTISGLQNQLMNRVTQVEQLTASTRYQDLIMGQQQQRIVVLETQVLSAATQIRHKDSYIEQLTAENERLVADKSKLVVDIQRAHELEAINTTVNDQLTAENKLLKSLSAQYQDEVVTTEAMLRVGREEIVQKESIIQDLQVTNSKQTLLIKELEEKVEVFQPKSEMVRNDTIPQLDKAEQVLTSLSNTTPDEPTLSNLSYIDYSLLWPLMAVDDQLISNLSDMPFPSRQHTTTDTNTPESSYSLLGDVLGN